MPSQVLQPSTPDADEHSSPDVPDPFSRRRSVSRFTFSSLDRPSDSPSDTPPPDRHFDPSPSPGTLATRKQSHIPVLPPTPTPRIPAVFAGLIRARSVESSGSAPARKKRRVDVSDDESETERPVDYEIGLAAAGGSARYVLVLPLSMIDVLRSLCEGQDLTALQQALRRRVPLNYN